MGFEGPSQKIEDIKRAEAVAHARNEVIDKSPEIQAREEEFAKIEYDTREKAKSMSDMELRMERARAQTILEVLREEEKSRKEQK